MARFVKLLSIFILIVSVAVNIESAQLPSGWTKTPSSQYGSVAQQFQASLGTYLKKSVVIQEVFSSFEKNQVADNHRYIISGIANVNQIPNVCTFKAYIGFTGRPTVDGAACYPFSG